jgi:hypothetical protein
MLRTMAADFTSIRNYHERVVVECVLANAARYPGVNEDLLPDVACVALNRLMPRYVRHEVDLAFYLTEKERADNEREVADAVDFAFHFVQARYAMRARR